MKTLPKRLPALGQFMGESKSDPDLEKIITKARKVIVKRIIHIKRVYL